MKKQEITAIATVAFVFSVWTIDEKTVIQEVMEKTGAAYTNVTVVRHLVSN